VIVHILTKCWTRVGTYISRLNNNGERLLFIIKFSHWKYYKLVEIKIDFVTQQLITFRITYYKTVKWPWRILLHVSGSFVIRFKTQPSPNKQRKFYCVRCFPHLFLILIIIVSSRSRCAVWLFWSLIILFSHRKTLQKIEKKTNNRIKAPTTLIILIFFSFHLSVQELWCERNNCILI